MFYYLNSKGGFNKVNTRRGKKVAGIEAVEVDFGGGVSTYMTEGQLDGKLISGDDVEHQTREEYQAFLERLGLEETEEEETS